MLKRDLIDFKPEDKIVNQFEEILRHNNVSDKENAFNRLIALFICKIADESSKGEDDEMEFQYKPTDTYETLQDRLQRLHHEGMEKFMHEETCYVPADYPGELFSSRIGQGNEQAMEDLKNTIRTLKFYSDNDFSFKDVHNEELFRQNGKVLAEMVQLFEKYRIVYPSKHQFLGDLFEQLLNRGFKQDEGQFFTPTPIARFVWDSLPVSEMVQLRKPKVIDYACGAGHFLTEAVEAIDFFTGETDNSWAKDRVYGIEKDYRLARASKISLFMNGAGEGNIVFGDGLDNAPDRGIENGTFDLLVSNPPYSVKGFKQYLQLENNDFTLLDKINPTGREIEVLFVERIHQLLKPDGIAAVILPASILSKSTPAYTEARGQILQNFRVPAIVSLGSKTFSTTGTNTVILFLQKFHEPKAPACRDFVEDVFRGEVGEDDKILKEYLSQIGIKYSAYLSFLKREYSLEELNEDPYFNAYVKAFDGASSDVSTHLAELYDSAFETEREKLFYFFLVFEQNTVVITAPSGSREQQEFLGYGWSNHKGSEGIQIHSPGGAMYDDSDRAAKGTLAAAIRDSFMGVIPSFSPKQSSCASVVRAKDMLDFSRATFNKIIRANVFTLPNLKSRYETHRVGDLLTLEYGKALPANKRKDGEYPVLGSNGVVGTHNDFFVKGPAVIVGRKGSAGSVTWEDRDCFPIDTAFYVSLLTNDLLLKYAYYLLWIVNLPSLTDKTGIPGLNRENVYRVKIPVPPLSVQREVIEKGERIDEEYNQTRMSREEYRERIRTLLERFHVIVPDGKPVKHRFAMLS